MNSYQRNKIFTATNLILLIIFVLQAIAQTSTPAIYLPTSHSRCGTFTAFNTLKTSSDQIDSIPITFTSPLFANSKLNAITSVSSFDLLASTEFSFNTSLSLISYSGFTVKLQIFGNTYLNLIKFNYLAMSWSSVFQTQLLYYDCFLTNGLSSVSDVKSQVFDKQKFGSTIVDGSVFRLQSFISGMKFFNDKDASKKVSVSSSIVSSTDYITQSVSITGNTILQWVCMGTVIIDTTYAQWKQQIFTYQIGSFILDRVTGSIDSSTFPSYLPKYDQNDNKFFGLIEIQLALGKPYQIIEFKSQNILTVNSAYESLAAGGRMAYLYYAYRVCNDPAKPFYSIKDELCWDICPDGTVSFPGAQVCYPCHYSCVKCTGTSSTQCTDCFSATIANKRGLQITNNTCLCKPGYFETGVPLCQTCSTYNANCLQCSSRTVCTLCSSSIFILNTGKCQCAANSYYIANNNVCAPYPGCVDAKMVTNAILCRTCDSSQNFQLNPSTQICRCKQNYVVSGSTCVDFCGDGINTAGNSTTYCDDGNSVNGDGCSNNCVVESGFGCFVPLGERRSYCSGVKSISLKYLWTERIVEENAGYLVFSVSPHDPLLLLSNFTYYVESTIPHSVALGTYDAATGILKVKVMYTETIQDQSHTVKITMDPYIMTVPSQIFTLKSSGVNYDLTIDSSIPKFNNYLFYATAIISGLVLIASIVFVFLNYKIAAVQLLLSSQVVYLGVIASLHDNLALYPLTATKFLAGFNALKQFEINKYNYQTSFVLSSYTFAQFLLNFNITPAILSLIILIILPLKINVWIRTYQRTKYTSPEMQQKLIDAQPNTSLKDMSNKIKSAQLIADTYVDKVYFAISLIAFLPIVLFFSIQLAFIGRIGRYQLPSFANIILSILLLLVDFSFLILIFQDTDKKDKLFNFASKKLKVFPNRLMMAYFCLACLFTIVLLTDYTLYVLIGMNIAVGVYVWVQNPFEKFSLEHIDSLSKPLISLICLLGIKAMAFFTTEIFIIPIIIISLLLISLILSIIRTVRVKLSRASTAKRILQQAQMDDEIDFEEEKNLKVSTDGSQFSSSMDKKKISAKLDPNLNGLDKNITGNNKGSHSNAKDHLNSKQNDDSAGQMIKCQDSPYVDGEEVIDQDEDELAKIKRSLRQDLKKRRGVVNKVNEEANGLVKKKIKQKKNMTLSFGEDQIGKAHNT